MASRQRVTLADVAARAGVSRSTASFVTSGRKDMRISPDASRRVLKAAEELGYRPNLTARSLRTTVTHTFGLLSDTIATEQFAGEMIHGALDAALQHGRLLFVAETQADPGVEERYIRDMTDRQVDGLVYAAMYTHVVPLPASLRGHPLVLLNCLSDDLSTPSVIPDEVNAGRAAARVLLEAGHRDGIHLLGDGEPDLLAYRERVAGIADVLRAADLRLVGHTTCAWWPGPAYEAVSALLTLGPVPQALICLNDRIALGAYQAVQAVGLRIPADISVVSFDDSDLASWLQPQLTTVALPHYELGHQAVDLLAAGELKPQVHRVTMPLRIRSSVAPPAPRRGLPELLADRRGPPPEGVPSTLP